MPNTSRLPPSHLRGVGATDLPCHPHIHVVSTWAQIKAVTPAKSPLRAPESCQWKQRNCPEEGMLAPSVPSVARLRPDPTGRHLDSPGDFYCVHVRPGVSTDLQVHTN